MNQHPEIVIPGMPHDPSLALWAPLYELDGASFASKDAYGHLCTRSGAFWTPHGDNFDGTDDKITISHHAALSVTDELTIIVYAKWQPLGTYNYPAFVSKGNLANTSGNYSLRTVAATQQVYFSFYNGAWIDINSGLNVRSGEFSFIAVTVKGNDVYFRVDHAEATKTKAAALVTNTEDLYIGSAALANQNIKGTISDVLVYNRAFSPPAIMQNRLNARRRMPWLT